MSQVPARPGDRREVVIGVLCLDTSFTKIPGHIRNPATFDFPVAYRVVEQATPDRVVNQADPRLVQPFIDAARELQAAGASAITSACGFLVIFQRELVAAVTVPLYTSSLIQLPLVHRMLRPGQKVGLLVASKRSLTRRHLEAIGGESVPVCVAGMEDQSEFGEVFLRGERDELDVGRLRREVLNEAERLAAANPGLGAIVVECTDLAPFSQAIRERLGVPVFDIVTLTEMVHSGLTYRHFDGQTRVSPLS